MFRAPQGNQPSDPYADQWAHQGYQGGRPLPAEMQQYGPGAQGAIDMANWGGGDLSQSLAMALGGQLNASGQMYPGMLPGQPGGGMRPELSGGLQAGPPIPQGPGVGGAPGGGMRAMPMPGQAPPPGGGMRAMPMPMPAVGQPRHGLMPMPAPARGGGARPPMPGTASGAWGRTDPSTQNAMASAAGLDPSQIQDFLQNKVAWGGQPGSGMKPSAEGRMPEQAAAPGSPDQIKPMPGQVAAPQPIPEITAMPMPFRPQPGRMAPPPPTFDRGAAEAARQARIAGRAQPAPAPVPPMGGGKPMTPPGPPQPAPSLTSRPFAPPMPATTPPNSNSDVPGVASKPSAMPMPATTPPILNKPPQTDPPQGSGKPSIKPSPQKVAGKKKEVRGRYGKAVGSETKL